MSVKPPAEESRTKNVSAQYAANTPGTAAATTSPGSPRRPARRCSRRNAARSRETPDLAVAGGRVPGCFVAAPGSPEYDRLWCWPSVLDAEPDGDGLRDLVKAQSAQMRRRTELRTGVPRAARRPGRRAARRRVAAAVNTTSRYHDGGVAPRSSRRGSVGAAPTTAVTTGTGPSCGGSTRLMVTGGGLEARSTGEAGNCRQYGPPVPLTPFEEVAAALLGAEVIPRRRSGFPARKPPPAAGREAAGRVASAASSGHLGASCSTTARRGSARRGCDALPCYSYYLTQRRG
jgi:hypothetical protein